MQEKNKRFRAVKFRFEAKDGTFRERYMVTENYVPLFRINQWLKLKSIRKSSTGKEYAKKITTFLNWLDGHGVSFENATNRHCAAVFASADFRRFKRQQNPFARNVREQFYVETIYSGHNGILPMA